MNPRAAARTWAPLSLMCVVLSACASDEDRVRDTVETFNDALIDRDGDGMCAQMTEQVRRQFLRATRTTNCQEAGMQYTRYTTDAEREILRRLEFSVDLKSDLERKAHEGTSAQRHYFRRMSRYDALAHAEGGSDLALVKVGGDFKLGRFTASSRPGD